MISIGVLNSKGGCGKTTLATSLAVLAAAEFPRVGLVDLDPQQGAARWCGHRGDCSGPSLVPDPDGAEDAARKARAAKLDVVIYDGGPGSLLAIDEVIAAVDLVVIPLRAGDQDIASTEYTVSACAAADRPYLLVVNEALPPATRDKRAQEVHAMLRRIGQPVAETILCRRVAYGDAMNTGRAASEIKGGKGGEAEREIEALYREVLAALEANRTKGAQHGKR